MIGSINKRIIIEHRSNEASRRLGFDPGIGLVGAVRHRGHRAGPEGIPLGP